MNRTSSKVVAGLIAVSLLAAACGSDSDDGDGAEPSAPASGGVDTTVASTDASTDTEPVADDEDLRELTVTIPFPSGAVFYPLFVAEDLGYFAEEGLTVTVEPVDGSGAIMQSILSQQAEIGLPSPGPLLQAVNEGAELQSVYTLFQSNVFALVTPSDGEVAELADLEGATIGVGTLDGGEVPFVRALLSQEAGLEEGDYDLLAVGDGGTAAVALEGGDVIAYAAAFPDVAILRLQGLDVTDLISPTFESFFDSVVTMETSFIEENPDVVEGFGRALAKATQWGFDNPNDIIDITSSYFPEEGDDPELTQAFLDETITLFELPPGAEGQFGLAVPEAVEDYTGFLLEQGEIEAIPEAVVFSNDFVPAYNDF
jgi:NitT/TauT family transport system substrate-binding protein